MSKDTGWLKVLAVVVNIAAIVLPPLGYVIHQQDEIKDSQRDLRAEIKVLKGRLIWGNVIPMGTRSVSNLADFSDLVDHLKEVNEFENGKGD